MRDEHENCKHDANDIFKSYENIYDIYSDKYDDPSDARS